MTISDEQLEKDKKYFFEFSQTDDLDFAQRGFCETMLAYISEVERLQNSLKTNSQIQQNFFNEAIKQRDDALAETKRLRAENEDLRGRLDYTRQRLEAHDSFPGLNKLTGYDDLKAENAELRKANALYRSQLEEAGILQLKA